MRLDWRVELDAWWESYAVMQESCAAMQEQTSKTPVLLGAMTLDQVDLCPCWRWISCGSLVGTIGDGHWQGFDWKNKQPP